MMLLKFSNRKYVKLYDSMIDGFVSMDMNGNIVEFNRAFERMTGYNSAELKTMNWKQLTPSKWHEREEKIIRQEVLLDGHSDIYEKEYFRKDSAPFSVEMRTYLMQDEDGNDMGLWSIVHDISNRKKAQEELLKKTKIDSLGVLAGGIAHDFNNILTAILGNISLAKLYAKEDPNLNEMLNEVEKASFRAKKITHQLLTFSKGGAPVKKCISIANILKDSASFVLHGTEIRCQFSIADDIKNTEVDENLIRQVIHNITLNARQATNDRGRLSITAENCTIQPDDSLPLGKGEYIKITISDDGNGISPENLSKIFDPYFTTKENGTGLGLALSYSIVRKHGGLILVDSELDEGSVFTIYLPASQESAEKKNDNAPVLGKKEGRILVMDDDEMILRILTRMIASFGFNVVTVKNGEEAVIEYKSAKEREQPFDIVIMDLTIPGGMGGKETIEVLKRYDPEIKAIVSSGYSNDPIMAEYTKYGFSGVVEKPYKLEDFKKVVFDLLENRNN